MNISILPLAIILLFSCTSSKQDKIITVAKDTAAVKENSIPAIPAVLTDSVFSGDEITDSIARILAPVKENFQRINAVKDWTRIDTLELNESTEGGDIRYYFLYDRLQKITRRELGETYQQVAEYYLLGNELSFVYEKTLRYNRPVYYDSAAVKASSDSEAFDIDKSTVLENRSYFIKNEMVFQLNNEKKKHYKLETERINKDFEKLYSRVKKKKNK